MPYCKKCGTEHPEKASFCPKCGYEVGSNNQEPKSKEKSETQRGVENKNSQPIKKETGEVDDPRCRQCGSSIEIDYETCPECGYKPKLDTVEWVTVLTAFVVGLPSGFIAVLALLFIIDTQNFFGGTLILLIFGSVAFLCWRTLYQKYQLYRKRPAEPPAS
jgi:ribosomal protein L37E